MFVTIITIQQKPCQNVNRLIMNRKTKIGGMKKCANPHDSCAIPHTPRNGNVKKGLPLGEAFDEKSLCEQCIHIDFCNNLVTVHSLLHPSSYLWDVLRE